FFFFQAEDGIRDRNVTGVQTCALPIYSHLPRPTRLNQHPNNPDSFSMSSLYHAPMNQVLLHHWTVSYLLLFHSPLLVPLRNLHFKKRTLEKLTSVSSVVLGSLK